MKNKVLLLSNYFISSLASCRNFDHSVLVRLTGIKDLVSMSFAEKLADIYVPHFSLAQGTGTARAEPLPAGGYCRVGRALGSLVGVHSLRYPVHGLTYGLVEAVTSNNAGVRTRNYHEKRKVSSKRDIAKAAESAPRMHSVAETGYQPTILPDRIFDYLLFAPQGKKLGSSYEMVFRNLE